MSNWKQAAAVVWLASMCAAAAAQQNEQETASADSDAAMQEAEARMREAELELEEAARRIAELSTEQLARAGEFAREFVFQSNRPVIGITIGGSRDDGPVEGVVIDGISPGAAAEEAGLLAGDVITAINEESMSSENSMEANRKLLEFMAGVVEGDVLDVEYLRGNRPGKVELKPRASSSQVFSFNFDGHDLPLHVAPNAPLSPQVFAYRWMSESGGHGFGDMEMVELNESLGRYFGTDSGLLVVKAPEDNIFKLQDGDVIKSIDGREPRNLHHAVRILSSYEAGETVKLEIMRDKRKQTLTAELPDKRHSMLAPGPATAPAPVNAPAPTVAPAAYAAPSAPAPEAARVNIIRKYEERT